MDDDEDLRIPRDRSGLIALAVLLTLMAGVVAILVFSLRDANRAPAAVRRAPAVTVDAGVAEEEPQIFRLVTDVPASAEGSARIIAGQTVVIRRVVGHAVSCGSGFVVTDNVIVSAAHVIPEGVGEEADVYCGDSSVRGAVVFHDRVRDVMIMEAEGCTGRTLAFDTRPPRANWHVDVAGFTFDDDFSGASRYHLRASALPDAVLDPAMMREGDTRRYVEEMGRNGLPRLVAFDRLLIPGNSGSPVYRDGKIVGMAVILDSVNGRTYMVPAATIRRTLVELHVIH